MQLLLVFTVLVQQGFFPLPEILVELLTLLVSLSTLVSGAQYVYIWGNSYWRETHGSH